MKRKIAIIIILLAISIISYLIGHTVGCKIGSNIPVKNLYPKTATVETVDYKSDTVTCIDENGNEWIFSGCEDWTQGDSCALLMDNNGTTTIYDDIIVSARYTR